MIGERFERRDGWIGEVTTVTPRDWYGFTIHMRNVNGQDPAELDVPSNELGLWRNCGPAVEDIAKRHGFVFRPSIEEAIAGAK